MENELNSARKPIVLCVDDEPMVLEALVDTLGRKFQILTATSGYDGLAILRQNVDINIVVSDMRMPYLSGAEFLAEVRTLRPDSVRLLLTGQTDVESAIAAINKGQIFRFLTKPCAAPNLIEAIEAAWAQSELIHAERELLEKTLCGSMETMLELIGLSNPTLHARALRVRNQAIGVAKSLEIEATWRLEVAAILSQLSLATLPHEALDHLCGGRELSLREQKALEDVPGVAKRLIRHIPRLDEVQRILAASALDARACDITSSSSKFELLGQILRIATEFEYLTGIGMTGTEAISKLEARPDINGFVARAMRQLVKDLAEQQGEERHIHARQLATGMVILEDVLLPNGQLLAPKGYRVTDCLVERIRNFGDHLFTGTIHVSMPRVDIAEAA